jgi:hypothetical protein
MKYEINDYVLLDLEEIKKNNEKAGLKLILPSDVYAKIIDICEMEYPYFVKLYDERVFFNNDSEIIRLLSPDEIEKYENKVENYNNIKEL